MTSVFLLAPIAAGLSFLSIATRAVPNEDPKPQWVTREVQALGVSRRVYRSEAAKSDVSYHVFLPAAYAAEPLREFPVVYWLHGTGGGLAGIGPVSRFFDDAMKAGKIPPMIVIFPNGMAEGMWCDSHDGKTPFETIVVKEIVRDVDRSFRTLDRRESRMVEGFSMGGYGAARLGLKYPQVFGAASMLGAGPLDLEFAGPRATARPELRSRILKNVFGGRLDLYQAQSPWRLAERNAAQVKGRLKLRILIGEEDFTLPANRAFSDHFRSLGIAHDWAVLPKVGHDALALLRTQGEANWAFYRAALSW